MSQVGGAHLKIKEVPDLGSSVAGWLRVLKQDTLALCVKTVRTRCTQRHITPHKLALGTKDRKGMGWRERGSDLFTVL